MRLRLVLLILFVCCGSSFSHSNSHVHSQTSNELTITENAYLNWLRHMGSRNHSIFEEAKNQFKPCKRIKVHKDPRFGNYTTVQMAINAIPIKNKCRVVISVGEGTYREKILIPSTMAYVSLVGAGANKTIIQWDDTADKKGENGKPLSTYNSATFAINAPFFVAKHITFENTAEPPALGVFDKQAVALRISGDTATFIGCKFIGSQDTLYDQSGRHYFKNCYIEGSVDFIFGDGLSLYENCHIHADARNDSYAALTAQSRESMLEETGFSFVHCKVTGSGPLYLGRAWGTFSRVVFAYTYMDKFVTPRGWFNWGDKNREMTVFYGEFKCSGPGANNGGRVSWSRELTPEEAAPFISLSFIDGHEWIADL